MKLKVRLRAIVSLGVFVTLCSLPLFSQSATTGAITGTVTDATGASVLGAEVAITDPEKGVTRTVTTNELGFYSAEALSAGTYNISVTSPGFNRAVIQNVALSPGDRLHQNVTLEVGAVETQVTVEAAAIRVETEQSASGGVISGQHVENLLLNGRNFLGLGLLVPGVNSASITGRSVGGGSLNAGGLTGETPLVINGLGREFTQYTVDGAYNMNTGNNINLDVTPPLDTIQEFKILKNNYSAKYGIGGSAQVMVETKSGTQTFHGALYEFLRNDAFDASNFFSAGTKTSLRQNNFGYALGGPVVIPGVYNTARDKGTFFFANNEWRIIRLGSTLRGSMIPADMRGGNFANSPTLGAGGLQLSETGENLLAESGRSNCIASPTQLNPNCFDQNAVNLMEQFWPLPNNPGGGFLNYINNGVQKIDQLNHTYRIDQYVGNKWQIMGRVSYEEALDEPPALVWNANPAPTMGQKIYTTGMSSILRLTTTISPTVVNTASVTLAYTKARLRFRDANMPDNVNINYPFANADIHNRAPQISISGGWSGMGVFPMPVDGSDGEWVYTDDLSIVKGNHVLQVGGLVIFGIKRQNLFSATNGNFSFSGIHSNDPVADYLLGLTTSMNQTSGERRGYFHYRQYEPYFQDDWKVARNLTLNLGVRYVYISPDWMEGDGVTSWSPGRFDPTKAAAVNPDGTFRTNGAGQVITAGGAVADLQNGLIFAGQNGIPRGFHEAVKGNFAPRLGFAWDVFGNGRTSVRGGYGIGYGRIPFSNYTALNNPPFIDSTTLLNGTLTNPSAGVAGALSPPTLTLIAPDFRPTRVQSWSFTIEQEFLRGGVFSIAYVGSGARFVQASRDLNAPQPVSAPTLSSCLAPGQTIPSGGFDFDPCLNIGAVSGDFTRPFSGWGGLSLPFTGGTSNYHSMQTGYRYRTGPLTFNFAYTWGRTLTNVANRGFDGRNTNTGPQNARDLRAEYGRPGWDRAHIFSSSYIWQLPFLKDSTPWVRNAFGGWTFSGITVLQSGFVLAPGISTGRNGLATRPDLVGPVEGPKTLDQWFNTAAFAEPARGFYGNAGTGLINGPSEQVFNLALFKDFPFSERTKLQFRAESFNFFNHPNFDAVQVAYGAPNFGQVTRAMEPRILEFGLRLTF